MLAGVRGCYDPIDEPRGIPQDATDEYKKLAATEVHTHSWYTLKELLNFNWQKPASKPQYAVSLYDMDVWSRKKGGQIGRRASHSPPGILDEYRERWYDSGNQRGFFNAHPRPLLPHHKRKPMPKRISFADLQKRFIEHGPHAASFFEVGVQPEYNDGMYDWVPNREGWDTYHKNAHPKLRDVFANVSWYETYEYVAQRFVHKTIPAMQELGEPNNVRILFFFDS